MCVCGSQIFLKNKSETKKCIVNWQICRSGTHTRAVVVMYLVLDWIGLDVLTRMVDGFKAALL